ncbi:hypothetical protein J7E95_28160 [Streptomyces sp. ISL-14]|nr:hypothetical protein [Streptomyces sp. ISL-14]
MRQVVARDLGSAEYGFAPASFGHRLIESGFIIDPAERAKPDTVNGWSQTDAPDRWQTVCYPTSDVVGRPAYGFPLRSSATKDMSLRGPFDGIRPVGGG